MQGIPVQSVLIFHILCFEIFHTKYGHNFSTLSYDCGIQFSSNKIDAIIFRVD